MAEQDFLAKIRLMLEGKDEVVSGLKDTQQAATQLGKTKLTINFDKTGAVTGAQLKAAMGDVGKETKKAAGFMDDFVKSIKRAIIVAPVWMAIRGAIQFVNTGLKDGIDYLIAFDSKMLLLEQSLRALGVTPNIEALKEQFDRLSISTGKATSTIVSDYQLFVKTLGDYKNALEGTTAATNLQEVAQSKSSDIITAVALAYRLQGDSISKTSTATEKFNKITAIFNQLAVKNRVDVDTLTKEYVSFVPTANALNLTFSETVSLLATLNSQGVQNVQGLRTALLRLFNEQQKIAPQLGIANVPNAKPYELFVAVLQRINQLVKESRPLPEAVTALFGGAGGGRGGITGVLALSKSLGVLKENYDTTFDPKIIKDFDANLTELDKSVSHQTEVWNNLRIHIFAALIEGAKPKDFEVKLKQSTEIVQNYGELIAKSFGELSNPRTKLDFVALFGGGDVTLRLMINLMQNLQKRNQQLAADTLKARAETEASINKEGANVKNKKDTETALLEGIKKRNEDINKQHLEEVSLVETLNTKARDRLYTANEQIKSELLALQGTSKTQIAYREILDIVNKLAEANDKAIDPTTKRLLPALNRQQLTTAIIKGDYETIIALLNQTTDIEATLPQIEKLRENLVKSRISDLNKERELTLSTLSTIGNILGVEQSRYIRAQMAYKYMLQGDYYLKNSMEDRLRLAEALTREADIQERKSAHLVDLYKIAQRYGMDAAREVSQLLGGERQITQLSSTTIRALRRFNPAALEEAKAQEFFRPTAFQFPEEVERRRLAERNRRILNQVTVEPVNVTLNINMETERILDKIKESIDTALDAKQSELTKKINTAIEAF